MAARFDSKSDCLSSDLHTPFNEEIWEFFEWGIQKSIMRKYYEMRVAIFIHMILQNSSKLSIIGDSHILENAALVHIRRDKRSWAAPPGRTDFIAPCTAETTGILRVSYPNIHPEKILHNAESHSNYNSVCTHCSKISLIHATQFLRNSAGFHIRRYNRIWPASPGRTNDERE